MAPISLSQLVTSHSRLCQADVSARPTIRRTGVTAKDLAEREYVGLDARIEERDLKEAVGDGAPLADQLIQPLLGHYAATLVVDVESVRIDRGPAVDEDPESHSTSSRCRTHDEMKIARVESARDPPPGLVRGGGFPPDRPVAGDGPLIKAQLRRR